MSPLRLQVTQYIRPRNPLSGHESGTEDYYLYLWMSRGQCCCSSARPWSVLRGIHRVSACQVSTQPQSPGKDAYSRTSSKNQQMYRIFAPKFFYHPSTSKDKIMFCIFVPNSFPSCILPQLKSVTPPRGAVPSLSCVT